jgi:hypothetical protein
LYQADSGEFVWDPLWAPLCGGFRGHDPAGKSVLIATGLRSQPDNDPYWQMLWISGDPEYGGSVSQVRADMLARGLIPLPPRAGSGLSARDERDNAPLWGGAILGVLGGGLTLIFSRRRGPGSLEHRR